MAVFSMKTTRTCCTDYTSSTHRSTSAKANTSHAHATSLTLTALSTMHTSMLEVTPATSHFLHQYHLKMQQSDLHAELDPCCSFHPTGYAATRSSTPSRTATSRYATHCFTSTDRVLCETPHRVDRMICKRAEGNIYHPDAGLRDFDRLLLQANWPV